MAGSRRQAIGRREGILRILAFRREDHACRRRWFKGRLQGLQVGVDMRLALGAGMRHCAKPRGSDELRILP